MDKHLELNKLLVKYAAARAILRVKLAVAYEGPEQEDGDWDSGTPTGSTRRPAPRTTPSYVVGGIDYGEYVNPRAASKPAAKPFQLAKGLQLINKRTGQRVTDPRILQQWVNKNQKRYNTAVNNLDTRQRLAQVAQMANTRAQQQSAARRKEYMAKRQAANPAAAKPTATPTARPTAKPTAKPTARPGVGTTTVTTTMTPTAKPAPAAQSRPIVRRAHAPAPTTQPAPTTTTASTGSNPYMIGGIDYSPIYA